ncbi:hypothetical protein ES332_D09G131100v1 [Gossypium tomentosum]|uniref:DNA/RNA-binding domain-containing protein n=1 Tax=Gossypium tomentosum TaxID=34277 RepID=A0A5D2JHF5_GOSTO|nr:hypothetical protein ES332_D09G131100v1 [Gossypium tomentosum]TYH53886.1 hypothetical protein ES332_D09G131100v1 [Gossypium tomentosum]
MMIVQMDKMSTAPSSRERAQCLYKKNIELENNRRKSAQARVPSDPNTWQQMRENYEAIILEDHAFSEQHNIEYALWQLHYKRIEELRAHYSAALTSARSKTSQGVKVPPRSDRLTKIRLQFKTFLSEATGFYHELILKIRAKYGLPFGYFSDDSESLIVMDKDGKKSAEIKMGLVSCHRCLIYLGDLARYKGLYGDGDSKTREYAAASSYYLQAVSVWPLSGNPHHQLAILASYSGDEVVAVYRYFRSLALDNPFSTARDNLIVAFEKNRHSCSQLTRDAKTSLVKEPAVSLSGKGRRKAEAKPISKEANMDSRPPKEKESGTQDNLKSFCIRFVRLNGILFTHTSPETFADVLKLVSHDLCELLSLGPEEKLSFGTDATENALFLVRLVSVLIFTVHNLKRESEAQTYAEIVQRAALLQNALTAIFELMGYVVERCLQLGDVSSSYTLPAILVFVEWLACCPDVATADSDVDEKQSITRSLFWKHCLSFLNKILTIGPMCIDDDEDETFFNMSRYEEGETENLLALWEDFELRGFLPLVTAHNILDFSRKRSFISDGDKEKKARVKRILAAGRALASFIRIDQKTVCFDSKAKKFLIGVEPCEGVTFGSSTLMVANGVEHETPSEKINIGNMLPISPGNVAEDDDDEVIVFQPSVSEKRIEVINSNRPPPETLKLDLSSCGGDRNFYGSTMSSLDSLRQHNTSDASPPLPASVGSIHSQQLQPVQMHASRWSVKEATSLSNSLRALTMLENGHLTKRVMQDNLGLPHPAAHSFAIQQPINTSAGGMYYSQKKVPETVIPSGIDTIVSSRVAADALASKTTSASQVGMHKNPVNGAVRHLGPPPGFGPVPPKPPSESVSVSDLETPVMDDYSWLDGYRLASSLKGSGLDSSLNYASHGDSLYVNNSSSGTGTISFPFPGKQVSTMQFQMEKQNGWQDYNTLDHRKFQHEQKLQQHQFMNGNQQQFTSLPEQFQGQSMWTGRYFV